MRLNLNLTHWSLLSITLISSCILFLIVFSENAKYANAAAAPKPAETKTDGEMADAAAQIHKNEPNVSNKKLIETTGTKTRSNINNNNNKNNKYDKGAIVMLKNQAKEKILPNYKKVKKITKNECSTTSVSRIKSFYKCVNSYVNSAADKAPSSSALWVCDDVAVPDAATSEIVSDNENIKKKNKNQINIESSKKLNSKKMKINLELARSSNTGDKQLESNIVNIKSSVPCEIEQPNVVINEKHRSKIEKETAEIDKMQAKHDALEEDAKFKDSTAEKPQESFPDMTGIPTVTVTELPLDLLTPATVTNLEALVIDGSLDPATQQERENNTLEFLESSYEILQKDEQIIKINDSGGGDSVTATTLPSSSSSPSSDISTESMTKKQQQKPEENIPTIGDIASATTTQTSGTTSTAAQTSAEDKTIPANIAKEVDAPPSLSAGEEVPIPVFSEWAQKQMEAAEKQQALEQEVVNTSAQKKNLTNNNGKTAPMKVRSKNYASPDCGAKIISSNSDASNTGAVLSSSKDEYMLSPCGNRIWFVVELCEAIQAQKIELANFELFSSSPKNFTVAVSNRFPTREWSNVGRFIAEDKRNIQSFDLHPHLFGKFVRVDIHSHYSKEHFCPVSLFRVFGTSEFEAFETENRPNDDLDDFDDDFVLEQARTKNVETKNLFKSASDAVMSIVLKAAEVLKNPMMHFIQTKNVCMTPAFGTYSCAECNQTLVASINTALSCQIQQLYSLLNVKRLRKDLLSTMICAKKFFIDIKLENDSDCSANPLKQQKKLFHSFAKDITRSYYLNLLPMDYIGALCQLLAENQTRRITKSQMVNTEKDANDIALNLTIDKKITDDNFKVPKSPEIKTEGKLNNGQVPTEQMPTQGTEKAEIPTTTGTTASSVPETTETNDIEETAQLIKPPVAGENAQSETTTVTSDLSKDPAADINIFNVPTVIEKKDEPAATVAPPTIIITSPVITAETIEENNEQQQQNTLNVLTSTEIPVTTKSEEDAGSWDSLETLLATPGNTPPTPTFNSNNLQQKVPSGPQSESIFIRLSNRIKALERNMSLSGQYLEELSRRYKKQVEELQQTLTQQAQMVRSLEEQNRRFIEREQILSRRNEEFQFEIENLTMQMSACIFVVIFVGTIVLFTLIVGAVTYRSMLRKTKELKDLQTTYEKRCTTKANEMQKRLSRRKSYDDFSDHQQNVSTGEKIRRPSEEAMLILQQSDSQEASELTGYKTAEAKNVNKTAAAAQLRQRKLSICYGSSNSLKGNSSSNSNCNSNINNSSNCNSKALNNKRKTEKHSWPNTAGSQQQARQQLEQLQKSNYDKFVDVLQQMPKTRPSVNDNVQNYQNNNGNNNNNNNKSKKKSQNLKRQESAPTEFPTTYIMRNSSSMNEPHKTRRGGIGDDFDECPLLDENDLDTFILNSDLAYNEFMPEGPSGYQIVEDNDNDDDADSGNIAVDKLNGSIADNNKEVSTKKLRRISSPSFFKSPFSKNAKNKFSSSLTTSLSSSSSVKNAKTPHESTSWEWYRSKKTEAQNHKQKSNASNASISSNNSYLRASPAQFSLDSSSLSEIHFPTNSTENSFRILEEAILSSGENLPHETATKINGNGQHYGSCSTGGSSAGSSSNRSSTSSTAKQKKSRSFNKIFRKVF